MSNLKKFFMDLETEDSSFSGDAVEVYADSVKQALELAARDLQVDISSLDYEVMEKGTKGVMGIGRQPYRVLVAPSSESDEHDDLSELERKLSKEHIPEISAIESKHADSTFQLRMTRNGLFLTISPPRGKGKSLQADEINNKLFSMRINDADTSKIEKEVKKATGKPVKIDKWTPNPEYDGTLTIELTEDEMKAFIHFVPPRYSGRHLEFDEIMNSLKKAGVKAGIQEDRITEYLDKMEYSHPLLAAEGSNPRNGKDGYVEYKVKMDRDNVNFEEDESGKVDFKNLELLENVVVGQVLAVKIPPEEGVPGRTITNSIMPARSGKDVKMQYGKGTILSEDGTELTAETNGQVVFKGNKISVEPVFVVNGDVSLETGNIVFLGSVIVSGSVQDNFEVKAAGNIEVKGTVQKAFLEAEGDIVVYQGISGREEAKIESTGGSVYAKFIQNANIFAENDVIAPEGILHSNIDAGEGIYSSGKKARIVGGLIRAGDEVNARFLGSDVSTKTEIKVGINPKILQQMKDLNIQKEKLDEDVKELRLNIKTLETQKAKSRGKLSDDKEKMFADFTARETKLTARLEEINAELEELNSYIGMLEHKGKVCAEKTTFSGVEIYIKDQKFLVKDSYNSVTFSLEGGEIKISEYEHPAKVDQKIVTTTRRRW